MAMVRRGVMPSLREASCCRVEVMKGGRGVAAACPALDALDGERQVLPSRRPEWRRTSSSMWSSMLLAVLAVIGWPAKAALPASCGPSWASSVQYSWGTKALISSSRSTTRRMATDCTRPADRPRRIFFHSSGAELIAHDAVQNAAGLLGVHQILIDGPGVVHALGDHLVGDLVEGDPAWPCRRGRSSSSFRCQEMASPSRSGSVAR